MRSSRVRLFTLALPEFACEPRLPRWVRREGLDTLAIWILWPFGYGSVTCRVVALWRHRELGNNW